MLLEHIFHICGVESPVFIHSPGKLIEVIGIAAYNLVASIVNPVIKLINELLGTSINVMHRVSHWSAPRIEVPKLAAGGLVDPGQLFLAREAGPELVGTIGGHTAVMNNNQIVAAVSGGVYQAQAEQIALLRQQNELLRQIAYQSVQPINVTTELDGAAIGKQVIKYHNGVVKQTGMSPLLV